MSDNNTREFKARAQVFEDADGVFMRLDKIRSDGAFPFWGWCADFDVTLVRVEPKPESRLPCPHCGGEALATHGDSTRPVVISCQYCTAEVWAVAEADAWHMWNRRA